MTRAEASEALRVIGEELPAGERAMVEGQLRRMAELVSSLPEVLPAPPMALPKSPLGAAFGEAIIRKPFLAGETSLQRFPEKTFALEKYLSMTA
jgi:hypothetical protein